MTANTRVWLHGLGAAFIGSAASSVGTMLVAPDRFNVTSFSGLRNLVLASVLAGGVNAAAYLKTSPLPPVLGPGDTLKANNATLAPDGTLTATSATLQKAEEK